MSESCDRCGPAVRAYRVERRDELYLARVPVAAG